MRVSSTLKTSPFSPALRQTVALSAPSRSVASGAGRVLHLADALIAATALVQGFSIATRNVGDFEGLGVVLHNPWQQV